MAPSHEAANAIQRHPTRPTPIKKILPAIPLPYTQRRPKHIPSTKPVSASAAGAQTLLQNGTIESNVESPPVVANGAVSAGVNGATDEASPLQIDTDYQTSPGDPGLHQQPHGGQTDKSPRQTLSSPLSNQSDYQMPPPFVPVMQQSDPSSASSVSFTPSSSQHHLESHHQPHPGNGTSMYGGYAESPDSSPGLPLSASQMPPPSSHVAAYPRSSYHAPFPGAIHTPQGSDPQLAYLMPSGNSAVTISPEELLPPRSAYYYAPHQAPPHSLVQEERCSPYATEMATHPGRQPNQILNGRVDVTTTRAVPFPLNGPEQLMVEENLSHTAPLVNGEVNATEALSGGSTSRRPLDGCTTSIPDHQSSDNQESLQDYLLSQFGRLDLADYILYLPHTANDVDIKALPVHGLLIGRSPYLRRLMHAAPADRTPRSLMVEHTHKHLSGSTLQHALKYLYGGLLPTLENLDDTVNDPSRSSRGVAAHLADTERMTFVLGLLAAGTLLEVERISRHAIILASELLSWETLGSALSFGLDGGLSRRWHVSSRRPSTESDGPSMRSHSRIISHPESSALGSPSDFGGGGIDFASTPTYGQFADELLQASLDHIIQKFPLDFTLDISGEYTFDYQRLPATPNVQSQQARSRLSTIMFGDYSEADVSMTSSSKTLSAILLNLPFQLLKYIVEAPRPTAADDGVADAGTLQKVTRMVVEERERQRKKLLRNASVSLGERATKAQEWEAVGWEESVVTTYGGGSNGVELSRRWRGWRNPTEKKGEN
ncbi:MAG: hypothetical protein M1817_002965 [Caeruleum heppii]|nr:MAG: hypothetical protein M1817_002965 [Caeruleum heppii]